MFGLKEIFPRPVRRKTFIKKKLFASSRRKTSRYPYLDAMTSSQLQAFVHTDGISLGEFEYAQQRLQIDAA